MSPPPNPALPASGQEPRALFDLLAAAAAEFPRQTATVFFGAKLDYRTLLARTLVLARSLQGLGVAKGQAVALMLPNCPQAVLALFALQRLGAVCVMINPTSPAAEIAHLLADSGAQTMLLLDQFLPQAAEATRQVGPRRLIATSVADFLPLHLAALYRLRQRRHPAAPPEGVLRFSRLLRGSPLEGAKAGAGAEGIALIQYTGGTTGRPKGVVLTQASLAANVVQVGEWLGTGARRGQERLLAVLPYFHVFGLTCALLFPVGLAAAIILLPRFEVAEIIKAVERERPSMLPAIPAMFAALVRDPGVARHDWGSLQWCISGASALSAETAALFRERTGAEIIQGYGLTEASPVTHVNPVAGLRKPGSIGLPLPRTLCRLVDLERGEQDVAVGEEGELLISGPQVMQGYWRLPGETERTLRGGWLYTGDIARRDADGYYYIVDRKKEMIITAGFNVYPSEVESAILELAGVQEAAVIGLPDPLRGEEVAAYIVVQEGVSLSGPQVREHCRARLAAYKVPRVVRFRRELPKSLVGKVLKRELKRQETEAMMNDDE